MWKRKLQADMRKCISLEKKNLRIFMNSKTQYFFLLSRGLVVHTGNETAIVLGPFITQGIFALKS